MHSPNDLPAERASPKDHNDHEVRRRETRGHLRLDWLDARFSFSFGSYRNPARNSFGVLQALNEDVIQPGRGFQLHPHENLEIFILPLQGAVEHRDNLGNHAIVRPGSLQKMRAGCGIWHSQMNPSRQQVDHHLQIWLRPRRIGLAPGIEQCEFEREGRLNKWQMLISENGSSGSLSVDQNATVLRAELERGCGLPFQPQTGRSMYLHVIHGLVQVTKNEDSEELEAGDAYVMPVAKDVSVLAPKGNADVLLFDLPPLSTLP